MSVLFKKLVRDIRDLWPQFLAITIVIVCGIATQACMKGAHNSLKKTRDDYYIRQSMPEFWLHAEKAPLSVVRRIRSLDGVSNAIGRIMFDVAVDVEGHDESIIARMISMPDRHRPRVGDIFLAEGRYFTSSTDPQIIINRMFARAHKLKIGDRLQATLNDKKQKFKIVGIATSPEYVFPIRGGTSLIPDAKGFGIFFISREYAEAAFDYEGAANSIVGTLSGTRDVKVVIDKAGKLLEPYGFTYGVGREEHMSAKLVDEEIKGLKVFAVVVAGVFLAVAAFVLSIMLSRLVGIQRTDIGVMMAFGYSRLQILLHYMGFSFFCGVLGIIGGLGLGYLFAGGLAGMYAQFFSFPVLTISIGTETIIECIILGLGFSLIGGLFAVRKLLSLTPAAAMLPEPPRTGKRVLLERIRFIWKAVPFRWKMITRNVSRNKLRAAVAVGGVAISTSILVLGFFFFDAMNYLVAHQYERVERQDVKVHFSVERNIDAVKELRMMRGVTRAEPILEVAAELTNSWRKKTLSITGLDAGCKLYRVLDMNSRELRIPAKGLLIGKRVADQLGLSVGDEVKVKPLIGRQEEKTLRVAGIVEQYMGLGVYMDIKALSRMLGERRVVTGALLSVEPDEIDALLKKLKDVPAVATADAKEKTLQAFNELMVQQMLLSAIIITIFAGVIAFAIVFTLTTVSILERSRELASLRVLGFSVDEVASVVFNENVLLALLGIVIGLPLGLFQAYGMVEVYSMDIYRIPVVIEPYTFFVSGALIFVFVMISNWISYRKIQNLDMVAVLKTRE